MKMSSEIPSKNEILTLFGKIDQNKSGYLSYFEISKALTDAKALRLKTQVQYDGK